ncbi:hypothetical protein [Denitromonas sp.]|uniref:hypothetical protein n=1 Tax=Denitromonas sp. TaxID=2734609 RepID=UPI003A888D1F
MGRIVDKPGFTGSVKNHRQSVHTAGAGLSPDLSLLQVIEKYKKIKHIHRNSASVNIIVIYINKTVNTPVDKRLGARKPSFLASKKNGQDRASPVDGKANTLESGSNATRQQESFTGGYRHTRCASTSVDELAEGERTRRKHRGK